MLRGVELRLPEALCIMAVLWSCLNSSPVKAQPLVCGAEELLPLSFTSSFQHEVGIAARLTFETVVGEKAESFLTVSSDGTAAVCYEWRRLLQQIPSRETARMCMRRFYFDARPGVRTADR